MAMLPENLLSSEPLTCPVCLDTLTPPIIQCIRGHSFCRACITATVQICPSCRGKIDGNTRNFQLEQLIESFKNMPSPKPVKAFCTYKAAGCRYDFPEKERQFHEKQCRFRPMICEAAKYAGLKCTWNGAYVDLYQHFREKHKNNCVMQFKTDAKYAINFANTFKDIQLINWMNEAHFFYYKFKLDIREQKAYWVIQFIGFEKMAKNFYYEFEIFDEGVRKIKFTEICSSDSEDVDKIFAEERCANISFTALKSFLNNRKELFFRFRIIKKNQ